MRNSGAFAADGGTILLDEIGELDFDLQAKLLRVLQERVVTPVGSHEEIPVDVRVIAATNRDLRLDVAAGRFRGDLYYRLNVVALHTLPLKDHPEDLDVLAPHYVEKLAAQGLPQKRLSATAIQRMRGYDWPGNVREMENVLERAILFVEDAVIGPESIETLIADHQTPVAGLHGIPGSSLAAAGPSRDDGSWPTMAQIEREHIRKTLQHTHHNQSAAARLLEINRHQLLRKMRKYGIETPPRRRLPRRNKAEGVANVQGSMINDQCSMTNDQCAMFNDP